MLVEYEVGEAELRTESRGPRLIIGIVLIGWVLVPVAVWLAASLGLGHPVRMGLADVVPCLVTAAALVVPAVAFALVFRGRKVSGRSGVPRPRRTVELVEAGVVVSAGDSQDTYPWDTVTGVTRDDASIQIRVLSPMAVERTILIPAGAFRDHESSDAFFEWARSHLVPASAVLSPEGGMPTAVGLPFPQPKPNQAAAAYAGATRTGQIIFLGWIVVWAVIALVLTALAPRVPSQLAPGPGLLAEVRVALYAITAMAGIAVLFNRQQLRPTGVSVGPGAPPLTVSSLKVLTVATWAVSALPAACPGLLRAVSLGGSYPSAALDAMVFFGAPPVFAAIGIPRQGAWLDALGL